MKKLLLFISIIALNACSSNTVHGVPDSVPAEQKVAYQRDLSLCIADAEDQFDDRRFTRNPDNPNDLTVDARRLQAVKVCMEEKGWKDGAHSN